MSFKFYFLTKNIYSNFRSKLNLNKGNILVIGLDVCHPTGENCRGVTAEPSVVGVTGNYLQETCAFTGPFFYQAPREEAIDAESLQRIVTQMLAEASKYRQIDTIVIMRDGVSEGQYDMVLNDELTAIKKGALAHVGHAKTKLLCAIVTKNGNARHFAINNGQPESLPPRSVVQFGTRKNFKQFYMIPHRAFQGTAKAIMVTVIHDDLNVSAQEFQEFTLALTHLHQISSAPVSLPEPIYQADEICFRGQSVYRAFRRSFSNLTPYVNGEIDYFTLSTLLSSSGGSLPKIRYTA